MAKQSRFRGPFEKQHGKHSQALCKSRSQNLYHIHRFLPRKLSCKKFLILTYKILRLPLNTLAVDEKYLVLHRDSLTIPIHMQLYQKGKIFSEFFTAFLKSRLNFKHFNKNLTLINLAFLKLRTPKAWSDKCLKSPVSEDSSRSHMVNAPNHC